MENDQGQHGDGAQDPQSPSQQQSPQAPLAAVTRGDGVPPPPPPPKTDTNTTRRATQSSTEKYYEDTTVSGHGSTPPRDPFRDSTHGVPSGPPRARSVRQNQSGENGHPSRRRRSGLDWIVPVDGNDRPYVVRSFLSLLVN